MNAEYPSPLSRGWEDQAAVDLWARTRAAGDDPDDLADATELVEVVRLCSCAGGPRPASRLAATWRVLLGWTAPYIFDPACPVHAALGDVLAWRPPARPPAAFDKRESRLVAWRYAPSLARGHRRPLAWWGHRHRPAGRVLVALPWCRPEWFTRCWCGALRVERGWHQPHPWPPHSPIWRAHLAAASEADPVEEAPGA
jgi:hypothetical protein